MSVSPSLATYLALFAPLYLLTAGLVVISLNHYIHWGDFRVWRFGNPTTTRMGSRGRIIRILKVLAVIIPILILFNIVMALR